MDEAVESAKKIAEALEQAHERGIVHRHLKPANVKLTPDAKGKVLDFGPAKAFAEEGAEGDASTSMSPAMTRDATRVGVILGTAAYMSPEQTKGKRVDKRTDIFSFGTVRFEMLAGRKAFPGEDVSDILAAVIKSEPEWIELPESTPRRVEELLRRCLDKDARRRLRDIGDARLFPSDELRVGVERGEEVPLVSRSSRFWSWMAGDLDPRSTAGPCKRSALRPLGAHDERRSVPPLLHPPRGGRDHLRV